MKKPTPTKQIIKKTLADNIVDKINRPPEDKEDFKTYYLIDGDIYMHTRFFVDDKTMSLTVMRDLAYIEGQMIKDMKAKGKLYLDPTGKPYFDLYHLSLWFFFNIPSKDYVDLFGFFRILMEINEMDNFIVVDSSDDTPEAH
jgi:hypothetical protein